MYQLVIRWRTGLGPDGLIVDADHFEPHRANAEAIAAFMSTYPQVHHAEVRREDDTVAAVYVAGRLVTIPLA
jgi:hypothetical protein